MFKKALAVDLTYPDTGLPGENKTDNFVVDVVTNLVGWLLLVLGSIAVISFVIAGIFYLTSAGYEDKMENAKRAMMYSIIGVVVGLLGFVVVKAIDAWMRGSVNF
ncbi:MAG: hypothetical protein U9Q72_01335 [Patescibacteria group bacterium]|nr:hypothetical protein [Candidatus Caldatribacteriota bacterium]MEA3273219.1 hypothetical protein [Patescibacteria group bacterium]